MAGSSQRAPAQRDPGLERLWLSSVCSEVQMAAEAVAAYFELLMRDVDRPVEGATEIHRKVRRLSSSLNELAAIAAAGPAGEAHAAQEVVLEDAVESAAALVYGEALRKQQRLAVDIDEETSVVRADPHALHRLLVSLLAHAVRATRKGGEVSVAARREDDSCVVSVSDVGGPIDDSRPSDASVPFAQFRAPGFASDEALGPGLALAAHLVRALGGDYLIERRDEGVNTFSFSLVE